jgi:hypothetical protein
MNWFNLKENKCPKCNKDITRGMGRKVAHVAHKPILINGKYIDGSQKTYPALSTEIVITHSCGFAIRESRYKEIVASTLKQEQLAEKWRKEDEENN